MKLRRWGRATVIPVGDGPFSLNLASGLKGEKFPQQQHRDEGLGAAEMEARLERSRYTAHTMLGNSVLEQGKGLVLGALSENPERAMFESPISARAPALL